MKNALMLYYSCSGNTKEVAVFMGSLLKERQWNVAVRNMNATLQDIDHEAIDLLIAGDFLGTVHSYLCKKH